MGSGGPVTAYTSSPAVEVPLGEATRGDVFQISQGDTYYGSPHTGVLLGARRADGQFDTVEGNIPQGSGRVVQRTRALSAPSGHQLRIWRFGRVAPSGQSPKGNMDNAGGGTPGFLQLTGWTFDPDTPTASNSVHVYVDGPAGSGTFVGAIPANNARPDVANAYPGAGADHGFSAAIGGIAPGPHGVWVYAINTAPGGDNPVLWTATVNVPGAAAGSPFGSFDVAEGRVGGRALLRGWTVDPDAQTLPTEVHVYVDGPAGSGARGINLGPADKSRPDVPGAHPGVGDNHGFETEIDGLGPGVHSLWVYAINRAGGGDNPLLRVLQVHVPGPQPMGSMDHASGGASGFLNLVGWTLDPDTPTTENSVHVYIDGPAGAGRFAGSLPARVLRPDVAKTFPGAGAAHGFAGAIGGISPGAHGVWVYAIDTGGGTNPLLWTATVNVPGAQPGSPFGSFDTAEGRRGGAARVTGWTIDPDAKTTPTEVHAYIDGPAGSGARGVNLGLADESRPDVPGVHPGAGDNHGFDAVVDGLAPGVHTLWVYAINNAGGGENPLLRSLEVVVPDDPGLASPPQTPAERGVDATAADPPRISFKPLPKRLTPLRLATRGLTPRLTVTAPAFVKVTLTVDSAVAKRLGLRKGRPLAVAQEWVDSAGALTAKLKVSRKLTNKLKKLRGARLRLTASATDALGGRGADTASVRLTR